MSNRVNEWFSSPNGWLASKGGRVVGGAAIGVCLTLFTVGVGALIFGTYGYGMFVAAPFFVGLATGYLTNRYEKVDHAATAKTVCLATGLAALALVLVALEGIVCILLAVPLALPLAVLGGVAGRAWAQRPKRHVLNSFVGFVVLPVIFAVEHDAIGPNSFAFRSSIDIEAPPAAVWRAVTQMNDISEKLELPFRLGVAFPVGAKLSGEGVGAIRYGVFSTGTAIERITAWRPESELSFDVVNEPPAMRELSPYDHVHAPHVRGYFTTVSGSFLLEPLTDNRTRLVVRTYHELKLEPSAYWIPIARWAIGQNDTRVLKHIKQQAERSLEPG